MSPKVTSATLGVSLGSLWERMRAAQPLVQCITNYVSMDLMANTLLAAGASPAMVRALPGFCHPVLCKLTGGPIRQSAKLFGGQIKGRVKTGASAKHWLRPS